MVKKAFPPYVPFLGLHFKDLVYLSDSSSMATKPITTTTPTMTGSQESDPKQQEQDQQQNERQDQQQQEQLIDMKKYIKLGNVVLSMTRGVPTTASAASSASATFFSSQSPSSSSSSAPLSSSSILESVNEFLDMEGEFGERERERDAETEIDTVKSRWEVCEGVLSDGDIFLWSKRVEPK